MPTTPSTTSHSNHLLRALAIAAGLMTATAGTATACGPNAQSRQGYMPVAPMFTGPTGTPATQDNSQRGIVGLWHVQYTDWSGNPFYEAYDQWHADGNEWETSFGDPRQGNYCLGTWTAVNSTTVQLSHFGWLYNPDGSYKGYFTLAETDTVGHKGNSYTGTFIYKEYDVNGTFTQVEGTQAATRFHL